MKREEAEKLVGSIVSAWTAYRGTYVGRLLDIVPSRPWRGKIAVLSVLSLPMAERAHILREDELMEVGGVNIKPFEGEFLPWHESAVRAVLAEKQVLANWEERNKACRLRGDALGMEQTRRIIANAERQLAMPVASVTPFPASESGRLRA